VAVAAVEVLGMPLALLGLVERVLKKPKGGDETCETDNAAPVVLQVGGRGDLMRDGRSGGQGGMAGKRGRWLVHETGDSVGTPTHIRYLPSGSSLSGVHTIPARTTSTPTDNCPQPKEAQPLSQPAVGLTERSILLFPQAFLVLRHVTATVHNRCHAPVYAPPPALVAALLRCMDLLPAAAASDQVGRGRRERENRWGEGGGRERTGGEREREREQGNAADHPTAVGWLRRVSRSVNRRADAANSRRAETHRERKHAFELSRGHTAMKTLRIGLVGVSGGRSLTRPFRDARRFPWHDCSPCWSSNYAYTAKLWICLSFGNHSLSPRAKP
jgi:hypothetical protein